MESLSTRILAEVAALPEATPIYAKALLHLGNRAAVDQALSRLVRGGQLMRPGRGLYVRPIETRFGPRTPSVEAVLTALQTETGEAITPSGASAANTLGLTTQVPIRTVYLTSGTSRRLRFGTQVVELRHAPRWQLTLPGRPAGEVIRALAWFGRDRGAELMSRLSRMLSAQTVKELSSARGRVPTWMAEHISALVASFG
jgi:hypothetical protein